MKIVSSLVLSAAMFSIAVPAASALTSAQVKQCNTMGQSLQVRQGEAQKKAKAREALVAQVETAGEAWEDAEEQRLFSASHAAKADSAKAKYDTLKSSLLKQEMALQSLVGQINEDVAAYNGLCATD